MSSSAWRETIDRTQTILQQHPDHCFVCGREIPANCERCAVEAFLDDAHSQRLAVVCDQQSCFKALIDPLHNTWQTLFNALNHWPDPSLYPLGPYWLIRRGQRFTFRTEQRRTTYRD